ncbi:MAG: DegV family protein [Dehalococcoidales bacterium]|nr:DegV family protein [Dehalococcoidales bacterium]
MTRLTIMTDTIAGIPRELAEQLGIRVVPTAYIIFDEHQYIEGVTLDTAQAYQLLRQAPDKFNTAAISPDYLLNVYRELSQKSSDILFITISLALSSVSRSAAVAADIFKQESPDTTIRILDSRNAASGQGLIVLAAARAAAQGRNLERVTEIAEQTRQKTGNVVLLDTLRYVYRTGRVPRFASLLGGAFGIKPLSRIRIDGELHPAGIVRTLTSGFTKMVDMIKEEAATDALHFMIMHADAPQSAAELAALLQSRFKCLSMIISEFSPVMAYGAGPGSLSIGFHSELVF